MTLPGQRALLLLTTLGLVGCFGTPTPQRHIYGLAAPPREARASKGLSVVVEPLKTGSGYDVDAMAYRVGETELRHYIHRRWAAEPAKLVAEALVRNLRAAGRFARVKPADELAAADLHIGGTVEAIEQVDHLDPKRWHARLALSLFVRDERTGRVLFEHEFDRTRPCARNNPAEVARVIGQILTDETAKLVRRVVQRRARPALKEKPVAVPKPEAPGSQPAAPSSQPAAR